MAVQPVGPLPASTYWRRRLLLLGGLLLAVVLVAKACGGQPKPASQAGPVSSPTPSTGASPRASAAASAPAASPSPAQLQECGDAVLEVTTTSDAEVYKSGDAPRFTLTVRNTGPVACRRALGPDAVELRVLSGEDRIWSSGDCNTTKGQGVLTLPAGAARAMTVQWLGKRTKPGCVIGQTALPGTYRVSAHVGSIVRQGSVFRITG